MMQSEEGDRFIKNFEKTEAKVRAFAEFAVWRSSWDTSTVPIDEGVFTKDPVIRAWQIPPATGEFLKNKIIGTGAKNILELGTSVGYSTLWLAAGIAQTDGHIYTIEYFWKKSKKAKEFFEMAGIKDKITLYESEIKPVLESWKTPLDFIFMDADKSNYSNYLELAWPHLRSGGMIVADNAGNMRARMKTFIDAVESLPNSTHEFIDLDNGLLIIKKN
jgi:predicted O-methyltransferase YrrM